MWLGIVVGWLLTGCCSNVFSFEWILLSNSAGTSPASLLTFMQFVTIVLLVFPLIGPWQALWPRIPHRHWITMVLLFWSSSMLNQVVMGWKYAGSNTNVISVPLHILIKSGGLVVHLLLGACLGKRYKSGQVLAVVIVTLGIICSTLASTPSSASPTRSSSIVSSDTGSNPLWILMMATSILIFTLLESSLLGMYQEWVYRQYTTTGTGSGTRRDASIVIEGVFMTHFWALPFFAITWSAIHQQFSDLIIHVRFPTVLEPLLLNHLPGSDADTYGNGLFWMIVINALSQLVCIASVHKLTTMASSLTVNLILTCRKLASLLLSIGVFGARVSEGREWLLVSGVVAVFGGSILYTVSSQTSALTTEKAKGSKITKRE